MGLWIREQQDRRVKIMDLGTEPAFYANAEYVHFPYSDDQTALRFLDSERVDYVILRRRGTFTDYYDDWLTNGIPDSRAKLVYASSGPNSAAVVVFKWRRNSASPSAASKPHEKDLRSLERPTDGPLHVDPRNRRYFADRHNRTVLLAGSHTWGNRQDFGPTHLETFDYNAYLDSLVANGHNFTRLWVWEQAMWVPWRPYGWLISPSPYQRTGPGLALDGRLRFNLEQLNPEFFARLRSRVADARLRGIYVAIMLFNSFSIERKGRSFPFGDPWRGHPFNKENNINGIDGDQHENGDARELHTGPEARILVLQERYVAAVIDAVSDLDNVLYEISNEDHVGSGVWQRHMVEFVHRYESMKGVHHPVGMTAEAGGRNEDLFTGPADWVSPNWDGGYDHDPPAAIGSKVVVSDTDHIWGIGGDRSWVWKSITRGLNLLFMDPYDNEWMFPPRPESESSRWSDLRQAIGNARRYMGRLDLSALVPHEELASTRYCLASPASNVYLVYVPTRETVEVDATASMGPLAVEWFEPATGRSTRAPDVTGGKLLRLSPPYTDDSVLLLTASDAQRHAR